MFCILDSDSKFSMEERKFVCKYCSKRFPCGKSLGGHIRTHMMSDHSAPQANEERTKNAASAMLKFDAGRKRKRDLLGSEAASDGVGVGVGGNNLIYGLREKPKKTMRFVHSNATLQLDKFCKECGKGFPSLKALCGHMACHSEKEKGANRFENNSGISEKQKLVMDSQSDTETSAPVRRSKRMRFKTLSSNNHHHYPSSSSTAPLANGSSSILEVEQEQEEVASCLMMLSKDNSHRGHFALFAESSDNNSIVLEAKSPSVDTKVTTTINNAKVTNSVSNGYGVVEKKLHKEMKLKYAEIDYDSNNSDSGYFRYGPKKIDSDDSNEGFFRSEVKASKVGGMSGFGDYDVELRKMLSKGISKNFGFKKLMLEDSGNGREDGATRRFDSRRRPSYDSIGQNLFRVSSKKKTNGFTNDEIYEHGGKSWKYESLIGERDNGSDDDLAYESDENSRDTDSYPAPKPHSSKNLNGKKSGKGKKKLKSKKSKEHECPICNKMFRSGQALGGHKRSHFVGGSEENTLVIRPGAPPAVPCLIDLNLPAPIDE